jgi:phosphocarrier protein HPr
MLAAPSICIFLSRLKQEIKLVKGMVMKMERIVTIKNSAGLHARPAAMLVQKASTFPCEISLVKGGKKINAKSIMNVIALGIGPNEQVTIITAGEQAAEALQAIGDFLESFVE